MPPEIRQTALDIAHRADVMTVLEYLRCNVRNRPEENKVILILALLNRCQQEAELMLPEQQVASYNTGLKELHLLLALKGEGIPESLRFRKHRPEKKAHKSIVDIARKGLALLKSDGLFLTVRYLQNQGGYNPEVIPPTQQFQTRVLLLMHDRFPKEYTRAEYQEAIEEDIRKYLGEQLLAEN